MLLTFCCLVVINNETTLFVMRKNKGKKILAHSGSWMLAVSATKNSFIKYHLMPSFQNHSLIYLMMQLG